MHIDKLMGGVILSYYVIMFIIKYRICIYIVYFTRAMEKYVAIFLVNRGSP